MPLPPAGFDGVAAWGAFAAILGVAFLVTWIVTDRLRLRRTPYIAVLSGVVLVLGGGYVVWSGTSVRELVVSGWGWALLAGAVAGAIPAPLLGRMRGSGPAGPRPSVFGFAYEGVLYGAAEGVLLAALPAIAVWQAMADAGWTDGTGRTVATAALAVLGSLVVVLVHHLGYAEFRRRESRKKLAGALLVCGLQAVAFVLTGNVVAPILAHVVLHAELLVGGVEMPPSAAMRPRLAYLAGSERVHERARRDGERLTRR
jgi:uncharacterized membrane protein YqjE